MKKALIVILLVLAITLSLYSYTLAESKGTEYKDKKDRFSLTLPAGWKSYEDEMSVYFEYEFENPDSYASFYVEAWPLEEGQKTVKDIATEIEDYDYSEEGFEVHNKVIEKSDTKVSGLPAVRIVQKSEMKETFEGGTYSDNAIIDEYYFIKGSQFYIISLCVSESAYEKIKQDFEFIVKSFKVGSKPFEVYMEPDGMENP